MGKGDKKTAKGKRTIGSFGNTRPKKKAAPAVVASSAKPKKEKEVKKPVKKPVAKKTTKKTDEK